MDDHIVRTYDNDVIEIFPLPVAMFKLKSAPVVVAIRLLSPPPSPLRR